MSLKTKVKKDFCTGFGLGHRDLPKLPVKCSLA